MPTLREFLASEAEKLRGEQANAMARRDEWIASVGRLLAQIQSWLAQADSDHVLSIDDTPVRVSEQGLGTYEIAALTVGLGAREVRIRPVARSVGTPLRVSSMLHVPRAHGRVDMTNGLDRFLLFRVEVKPEDRWMIVEQDGPLAAPLDRSSFETALLRLLE